MSLTRDPRIPDATTPWTLWHSDTFDHGPASQEASGTGIVAGLLALWDHVLREGVFDDGQASFSAFCLTWGQETSAERIDVTVQPSRNLALAALRQRVYPPSAREQSQPAKDRELSVAQRQLDVALLQRVSNLHFELLLQSPRWTSASTDWGAESQQVLAQMVKLP